LPGDLHSTKQQSSYRGNYPADGPTDDELFEARPEVFTKATGCVHPNRADNRSRIGKTLDGPNSSCGITSYESPQHEKPNHTGRPINPPSQAQG
jgi:hypothetical protein